MIFHFLFEQSGRFKNEFKKRGHTCYDYDIENQFNETDFVIDIFKEIATEYDNLILNKQDKTIFTEMSKENDFIIAFFPCTYFCDANQLIFKRWSRAKRLDFDEKQVKRLIQRNKDRAYYFENYLKLCFICQSKGIPTIIENPCNHGQNYLEMYSPIDIGYTERNRALFGDNYKKPTNYFAINFEIKEKINLFYDNNVNYTKIKKTKTQIERSLMTKTYIKNFYNRFIENNIKEQ